MTDITERLNVAIADRYVIERELGQGGMATVYLAHDVKHDRKVALKVLRPELAAVIGAERFLQEIKVTANLQHSHILPLYDSGAAEGFLYYVMPYVEGETLRTKLTKEKQLGVDDAIALTRGIAGALEHAHKQGIIHRDIKPENILLRDNDPLIADFGIALALSHAGGNRLTETGLSIGTPHYMSPEQAMGDREMDARSDIYSLGAMLYEMLVGDPPYTGSTAQAIVAKVITEKATPVASLRDTVPHHVSAAIQKALAKLPADRFPSAASFAEALVRPGMVDTTEYRTAAAPVAGRITRAAVAAGLVVVAALAGVVTAVVVRPSASARIEPVGRFVIPLPEEARHTVVTGTTIALSPDGARVVYVGLDGQGNRRLFLRGLDQVTPSAIQGSELALQPFVAPDGLWVGFFRQNRIYKVSLTGGPVLPIAAADSGMAGASWGSADQVVFATQGGLRLVPAAGGAPAPLTVPDSGEAHRWPEFLPDGRHVLFTIRTGSDRLALVRVADGHITRFEQFGSHPRYVDAGYVILATLEGTVLAVPFDARRLRVTGPAVPLAEGVSVGTGGASRLGVARNGTLVYATGGGGGARQIVRVSREGVATPLTRELRDYAFPRLSPDGRRLAVAIAETERSDIWTYDIEQGVLTRLTFDGSATRPFWTPDGRRIAFTVDAQGGDPDVFWVLADGSGVPEPLLAGPGRQLGDSWSPDGRTLLVHTNTAPGQNDIALLQLPDSGPATPLLATPADEAAPAVSPDGRWLAFTSNESLRYEVYLRSFPELGAKIQVSVNGGTEPRWSPTGRELFYRDGDRMMVVPVQFTPALRLGPRTELFRGAYPSNTYFPQYDVTSDGQHFVFPQGQDDGGTLVAVLHWFDQFRSRR